jgi:hypothetical protein
MSELTDSHDQQSHFQNCRLSLSGTPKSQLNSPASSKIPLNYRDLYGDMIKKAKGSVPLRPNSRLKRSSLKLVSYIKTLDKA